MSSFSNGDSSDGPSPLLTSPRLDNSSTSSMSSPSSLTLPNGIMTTSCSSRASPASSSSATTVTATTTTASSNNSSNSNNGKPRRYKCKQCDYVAISKTDFWAHRPIHIKVEKQLTCPKCPFVTEFKHHLEYHLRNHFNSKPFECSKCSYKCVNKSMLNSHMKSHSNVYQFQCKDCSYATKYCHSLKMHLRKHKHSPSPVLNLDGTINPYPIIDVYGTRRGPRPKRKSHSNSSNKVSNKQKESPDSTPNGLTSPMLTSVTSISTPTMSTAKDSPLFNGLVSGKMSDSQSNIADDEDDNGEPISNLSKGLFSPDRSLSSPSSKDLSPLTLHSNGDHHRPLLLTSSSPPALPSLPVPSGLRSTASGSSANGPGGLGGRLPSTMQLSSPRSTPPLRVLPTTTSIGMIGSDRLSLPVSSLCDERLSSTSPHQQHNQSANQSQRSPLSVQQQQHQQHFKMQMKSQHNHAHHFLNQHSTNQGQPQQPKEKLVNNNNNFNNISKNNININNNNITSNNFSPSPHHQHHHQNQNYHPHHHPLSGLSPNFANTVVTSSSSSSSSPFTSSFSETASTPSMGDNRNMLTPQADLPLINPFQDLSLFCSESQTSQMDYISRNIRIGVPFLCIPLLPNDLIGPTVLGANNLVRNIPLGSSASPLNETVTEEEFSEDETSDMEESFPLDLTRNKNKSMSIITPITGNQRDSKPVKFLID